MNWKYHVGRANTSARNLLLSRSWFPLTNAVPWGVTWPYDVTRLARTRAAQTIFDVGANVGQTAILLHRFFPGATIHSFEPVPSTYGSLSRNVGHIEAIRPHGVALGAVVGVVRMSVDENSETNSVVRSDDPGASSDVSITTIDDFSSQTGIAHIDVLKIDVEGHELQVLEGASSMLRAGRIDCVYVEVGFDSTDLHHTPFETVRACLESHGFVFSGLYEPWRYPDCRGRIAFANALFWHPDHQSASDRP
jgi:FkbM family methyltransferase